MIQNPAIIFGFIMIFMLVSGLIVLWRRGAPQSTRNPHRDHEDQRE